MRGTCKFLHQRGLGLHTGGGGTTHYTYHACYIPFRDGLHAEIKIDGKGIEVFETLMHLPSRMVAAETEASKILHTSPEYCGLTLRLNSDLR